MCACVCLSVQQDISGTTRAILTKFFVHIAYGRGSVLLRQGDKSPAGRGSFGVFFHTDNALYSIAFGTHTKMAEPVNMPFGMMSGLGVLHGSDDPQRGRCNFWEKTYPTYRQA